MVFIRDKFRKKAVIVRGKVNDRQVIKRLYQASLVRFHGFTN